MVVSTAFKSFTSASNVFLCFLVWYYSGFVNNIFYKAFVVQGTGVYDLQLQVGVSLILGVLWSTTTNWNVIDFVFYLLNWKCYIKFFYYVFVL